MTCINNDCKHLHLHESTDWILGMCEYYLHVVVLVGANEADLAAHVSEAEAVLVGLVEVPRVVVMVAGSRSSRVVAGRCSSWKPPSFAPGERRQHQLPPWSSSSLHACSLVERKKNNERWINNLLDRQCNVRKKDENALQYTPSTL